MYLRITLDTVKSFSLKTKKKMNLLRKSLQLKKGALILLQNLNGEPSFTRKESQLICILYFYMNAFSKCTL